MEGLTLTYPLCFFTFMRVLLLEGKLGMLHMMFSKYILYICFYGPGNKVTLTMISPEVLASSLIYAL